MTSLPEQFSAVGTTQVRAQFDFLHSFATQALEGASRVASLNLAISRDAVERSTRAAQTLMASRDPRDLLVFGGHAEEQVRSLFDYSRELMGIASGVRLYAPLQAPVATSATQLAARAAEAVEAVVTAPAPVVSLAETEVVVVAQPEPAVQDEPAEAAPALSAAPPSEPAVAAELEAAAEAPVVDAPAVEALAVEPAPVAEPTAIAAAAGQGEAQAGVAPHPAAAPVPAEGAAVQVPKVANSSRRKK